MTHLRLNRRVFDCDEIADGCVYCDDLKLSIGVRNNLCRPRNSSNGCAARSYRLQFTAAETKTQRAMAFDLPKIIAPYIKRSLIGVRPFFPDAGLHQEIWPTLTDGPMKSMTISPIATHSRKPVQWPWRQTAHLKTQLRAQASTFNYCGGVQWKIGNANSNFMKANLAWGDY